MYTRNLIGSLAASAFRLSDVAEHIGIWFILQDLSVRTEGSFRYVHRIRDSITDETNVTLQPAVLFRERWTAHPRAEHEPL